MLRSKYDLVAFLTSYLTTFVNFKKSSLMYFGLKMLLHFFGSSFTALLYDIDYSNFLLDSPVFHQSNSMKLFLNVFNNWHYGA